MAHKFFITGTDTNVGKTLLAAGLLVKANQLGLSTAAIKPVSAGCETTAEGLRNGDAVMLQKYCSMSLPYEQVNPVALKDFIAPHIAAADEKRRLDASRLAGFCRGVFMQRADLTVIEGAGGWRVPLNERQTFAHLAIELQCPVILVVAMRLGCLNHALLTAEAIVQDGLPLAGWVANAIDPEMERYAENLESLKSRLPAPLLGKIPYLEKPAPEALAKYLDLDQLLKNDNP